jgi:hypothetical protein
MQEVPTEKKKLSEKPVTTTQPIRKKESSASKVSDSQRLKSSSNRLDPENHQDYEPLAQEACRINQGARN